MTDTTHYHKKPSVFSSLCRCISWKTKTLIPPVNLNTMKWKGFSKKSELQTLPTIFALLIDLYDGKDVYETLEACRINPDYSNMRNDLEYYVPQLTNFMVFHQDFANDKLNIFLENLSKADPYFAHLYYWYLNSLSLAIDGNKGQKVVNNIIETCSKESMTQMFFRDYEKFFTALEKKLSREEFEEKIRDIQTRQSKINVVIKQYKESKEPVDMHGLDLNASDIELRPYISPFLEGNEAYFSNYFTSALLFFEDLYLIAEAMNSAENKPKFLKRRLRRINKTLPSTVYIPFVKDSTRCYAVLNIAIEETKVFSTKERAPFYICLELFKPQEELAHEYTSMFSNEEGGERPKAHRKTRKLMTMVKKALSITKIRSSTYIKMDHSPLTDKKTDEEFRLSKLDKLISSPLTLKQPTEMFVPGSATRAEVDEGTQKIQLHPCDQPSENFSQGEINEGEEYETQEKSGKAETPIHAGSIRLDVKYPTATRKQSEPGNYPTTDIGFKDAVGSPLTCKLSPYNVATNLGTVLEIEANDDKDSPMAEPGRELQRMKSVIEIPYTKRDNDTFFGEDSRDQAERIKNNSPFKSLKTWRLLPLIVKVGADMKEEQFAVQLISQFDQIFKAEKLKLILTPYEIMSIGTDMGLVEVLTDALTFSNLKEKMYQQNIPTLNDFFENYFGKDVDIARKRFCRSLAAYSLICYFLQIKDRHNGNILLHKQGHILHIDFGFFLSNAPGKGLEFEKKVPFKLLHEYIEVLGGHRSSLFQEFRKLFYKGFMAARKHREQILILVKMMYSSQGGNLPCFRAGIQAINELEQRFCPDGVSEKDLTSYCYNLINQSVDNWRAKCYDKYQYYAQGIFY